MNTRVLHSQARQAAGSVLNGQQVGGRFAHSTAAVSGAVLHEPPRETSGINGANRRLLPSKPRSTVTIPGFPMLVDSNFVGNPYALKLVHTRLPGTLVSNGQKITYVSPGLRQLHFHSDGTIVSPGVTESGDIFYRTHWDSDPREIAEDMCSAMSLAIADDAAMKSSVERYGDEYELDQMVVEVHPHRETVQLFYASLASSARGSLYYDNSNNMTTLMDPKNRPLRVLNTAMKVGEVIADLAPENRNPHNVFSQVIDNFRQDPDYWVADPRRSRSTP